MKKLTQGQLLMSYEYQAAVIFAKEIHVFLLQLYALGQLECFLLSWYMKLILISSLI